MSSQVAFLHGQESPSEKNMCCQSPWSSCSGDEREYLTLLICLRSSTSLLYAGPASKHDIGILGYCLCEFAPDRCGWLTQEEDHGQANFCCMVKSLLKFAAAVYDQLHSMISGALPVHPASTVFLPSRSGLFKGRRSAVSLRRSISASTSLPEDASVPRECKRRDMLKFAAATTSLTLFPWPQAVQAAVSGSASPVLIADLRDVVQKDFVQNQYYVTGRLSPEVYTPDCQFKDPTTNVKGVQPYTTAVSKLFDPAKSKAELVSLKISGPNMLTLKWRLAATLNVPGSPAIKPYTGTTKYVTNTSGLICQHLEEWDISALDAFVSVLFPNFGAPPAPPLSQLVSEL